MRFHLTPAPLLHLITTILLTSAPTTANPQPAPSALRGYSFHELFGRWECSGVKCGYYDQLCCSAGSACYTNAQTQAECTANGASSTAAPESGGHWTTYTRTTVVTDQETLTTVMSSYISDAWASSSSARCHYALGESSCMDKCCASNEYCKNGKCEPAYPGQTTTTTTVTEATTTAEQSSVSASPGVRKTTVSGVVITQTSSPTKTLTQPYETPVATGANITMTEYHTNHLSGGEIAGIVIGVLVGIFLLALLCFYCCLKGIFDSVLAIFGLGSKRDKRKVTETDEYVRRSHYSSDGRKRTWYGTPVKTRREKREDNTGKELLGLGAGLGALWVILGLKRRREDRKKVEVQKYNQSEYSYSSDYYTSESSASSEDRRTERYSRHSVRRSESRRP